MQILFDQDFDNGAWPGPLGNKDTSFGEAWLGPIGFIDLLENQLGLTGKYLSNTERALRLIQPMNTQEGFWSKSATVDPMGTAKKLLNWRDDLCLQGWQGQGKSQRLRELAAVTQKIEPGMPDRLQAIVERAKKHPPDIEEINLFESEKNQFSAWRKFLALMRGHSTKVQTLALPLIEAFGDLGGSQRETFIPKGDGSLQLLRTPGYYEACEEAAAWMASLPKDSSRLVVWPDPGLDAALHLHGHPTLGASSELHGNALLGILPLMLELAWDPQDPKIAFELLSMPVNPIRPAIAEELIDALHKWPAVNSPDWKRVLEKTLVELVPTPKEQKRASKRLATIFTPTVSRAARYPATEITIRTQLVEEWAHAFCVQKPEFEAKCESVHRQCAVLTGMIESCGMKDFSRLELVFLVREATQTSTQASVYPAQAGVGCVYEPGAIAGPVDYVLCWDFTLSNYSPTNTISLSDAERSELEASGIKLMSATQKVLQQASRWRRPFGMARKAVLCVSPQRSREGNEEFPHPAWDEIKSRVREERPDLLEVSKIIPAGEIKTHSPPYRAPVRSIEKIEVPKGALPLRKVESPSSIGRLLGCSLAYGLHYIARIKPGRSWELMEPTSPLALGSLSHDLLALVQEEVKKGKVQTVEQGKQRIQECFDELAPKLVAGLFLPGNQDVLTNLKARLTHAVQDIMTLVEQANMQVREVEHDLEVDALGIRVGGRLDLLMGEPTLVLDFKWSGTTSKKESLLRGTAYQLAIYSRLLKKPLNKEYPGVAYYVLKDGSLLTNQDGYPIGEVCQGPDPSTTWAALDRAFARAHDQLRNGQLFAAGNVEAPTKSDSIKEGELVLKSNCEYCSYGALCGQWFGSI